MDWPWKKKKQAFDVKTLPHYGCMKVKFDSHTIFVCFIGFTLSYSHSLEVAFSCKLYDDVHCCKGKAYIVNFNPISQKALKNWDNKCNLKLLEETL